MKKADYKRKRHLDARTKRAEKSAKGRVKTMALIRRGLQTDI